VNNRTQGILDSSGHSHTAQPSKPTSVSMESGVGMPGWKQALTAV